MFFFSFSSFYFSLFLNSCRAVKVKAPTPVTLFFLLCFLRVTFIHNMCFCLSLFFGECGLFVFVRPSLRRQSRLQSSTPAARRFKSGEINKLSCDWSVRPLGPRPTGRPWLRSVTQSNTVLEASTRSIQSAGGGLGPIASAPSADSSPGG